MPDLVPVHGGLDAPVSRTVPLSRRRQFLQEAGDLPRIEVNRADLSTVYRIADGTLALRGWMFSIATATVTEYNRDRDRFVPVTAP